MLLQVASIMLSGLRYPTGKSARSTAIPLPKDANEEAGVFKTFGWASAVARPDVNQSGVLSLRRCVW